MSGRPKAYNKAQIIQAAQELFWKKGYAGTSLSDLTQEMHISKSTFYAVFESKDNLYQICLEEYGRDFFKDMVQKVTAQESVLSSLHNYYRDIALENAGDLPAKGCLIVNAANEIGLSHERLSPIIQGLLEIAQTTVKNALELAIRKGELESEFNSTTAAIYLVNQMFGLRTMVKSGADPQDLKIMVDQVFKHLTIIHT